MESAKVTATSSAIIGIYTLLLIVFAIFSLYVAQSILIPLALAVLLTFLLSHLVSFLERWLGRIMSILLTVIIIFIGIGTTGYIMTVQLIDLAVKLPNYKTNIISKIHTFHLPQDGIFKKLSDTFEDLKKEFVGNIKSEKAEEVSPLQVIEEKIDFTSTAKSFFGIFFNILATTGFVMILVFFMLLNREDLRGRLIKLIGQGRIGSTTIAIDDASNRIFHYLYMQTIVNLIFGTCVAIGLYFIGIPNAILWGGLGFLLRFIPYLGVWLASFIPVILSFAVSASWATPGVTICLFLIIELILVNFVEPMLYGSSTGIAPTALIIAAVFWTWLWGPVGLILSTPLTVCLVVMGHHVANLKFLSILLSDEEPLKPYQECYYRLLSSDQNDALTYVEAYLKTHTFTELYDNVLIPVIITEEMDRRSGLLDVEQSTNIRQSIHEIIDDLYSSPQEAKEVPTSPELVLCLPAKEERDELAGAMLTQLLRQKSILSENVIAKLSTNEMLSYVQQQAPHTVCISVVAPTTLIHARYLSAKLRQKLPTVKIIVGIWEYSEIAPEVLQKMRSVGVNEVVRTLHEAVALVSNKNLNLEAQ